MAIRVETDEPSPRPARDGASPLDARGATRTLRPLMAIGKGGMGRVELAVERREPRAERAPLAGTLRLVAVKRLLPELADEAEKRELFFREARLATRLDHPNVVRTRDFGEERGEPFLVMDFVDGVPLDRLLAATREAGQEAAAVPRDLAAHVLSCVAAGLHAAHELRDDDGAPLNLVHRDVSPHNVMVSREGDVLLLDFGVAKIDTNRGLTKTGEVRGKTAYMSPEQGLGDPVDRRSDLFAVGALLFECVHGARMWGEGTELDVLRRLALEEAPRLPGDDELCALHARLVARDPERRPSSADEVARALRGYADASAEPGVPSFRERLGAWVERAAGDELRARAVVIQEALGTMGEDPGVVEMPASARRSHVRATTARAEPVAPSERVAQAEPAAPARAARRPVLAMTVLAVLGGTALFGALRSRAPSETASRPPAPSALPSLASTASPSSTPPASVSASPPDLRPAELDAAPTRPASTGRPPPPLGSARGAPPRPSASTSATPPRPPPTALPSGPPLDVDPTPF